MLPPTTWASSSIPKHTEHRIIKLSNEYTRSLKLNQPLIISLARNDQNPECAGYQLKPLRFVFSRVCCLPNNFESELNLPRWRDGGVEHSCATHYVSTPIRVYRSVVEHTVVQWRCEVRMIENVEDLYPELHIARFRDPLYVIVLRK